MRDRGDRHPPQTAPLAIAGVHGHVVGGAGLQAGQPEVRRLVTREVRHQPSSKRDLGVELLWQAAVEAAVAAHVR